MQRKEEDGWRSQRRERILVKRCAWRGEEGFLIGCEGPKVLSCSEEREGGLMGGIGRNWEEIDH